VNPLTLDGLRTGAGLEEQLTRRGLHRNAADAKARMLAGAAERLVGEGVGISRRPFACLVPGRIEVLGKHTDYAGGRSLVVAVDRGFCAVATPRQDGRVRVFSTEEARPAEFEIRPDILPPVGHWSNYPMTVARRLARNFAPPLFGADIVLDSDLPRAAGMSSSSALMIAVYSMLAAVNRLDQREEYRSNISSRLDLAGYLATIENGLSFASLDGDRGVGTFGGSEDHTAILFARPGQIVQYSYCPVRFERCIRVQEDLVFAVAQSGIVADKTGGAMDKYNRVSNLARAVVELWREATGRDDPHLAAVLASSADAANRMRGILQASHHPLYMRVQLQHRFEQFVEESGVIIPAVPDAITNESLADFGQLADRSQAIGAERLQNQTPETIWLARFARQEGALAASAFGAGFGGSVWALVREADLEPFLSRWSAEYARVFPEAAAKSAFFATRPGPPAFSLDEDADR
jgi:galactokinase